MSEPLTPADLDLRDMQYMPLDVVRLRDSDIAALSSGDAFRAAVMLWCAAWHQVPAASLPADDANLARYSGYGRDVRAWQKVKADALHGFVECSDGRLYHPVIAEKAIEADDKRKSYRERTRKASEARRNKERDDNRNDQRNDGDAAPRNEDQGKVSKGKVSNTPELRSGERKRGTRLPDDFTLSEADIEFAAKHGLAGDPLQGVFQDFCDYWRAKPGALAVKVDWPATWRRWVRTESQKQPQRRPNGTNQTSHRRGGSILDAIDKVPDGSGEAVPQGVVLGIPQG